MCIGGNGLKTTGIFIKEKGKIKNKQISLEKAEEVYKENPGDLYSKDFFQKMQKVKRWQVPFGKKFADVITVITIFTSLFFTVAVCAMLWKQYKKHILES